jgi:hypothetical protein
MPTTQDFEYLLECKNVIGVDYDDARSEVRVFVSQKQPVEALDEEDDIERRVREASVDVEVTVDVVDAGYGEERRGFEPLATMEPIAEAAAGRNDRYRPVPAGASESHADLTAGTGGPYPARVRDSVDDAADAVWDDGVDADDLVRLSNNHVYALSNDADLGDPILQPAPHDGGSPDDKVGELVGYVPIEDGVRVDVAARSVEREDDSTEYYALDEDWPTGVRRSEYGDLRDEPLTKTGRTTGVTSATVEATDASVSVEFGADHGSITFRNQLITGYMSEGGDSGSAVFLESGKLVGLLFAGSAEQTICNRIGAVEEALGVEILVEEPDNGGGNGDEGDTDEDVPVYTTTLETALNVDLEDATLELESVTFSERPRPGSSVSATVAIAATDPGTYWVEVDESRETFEVGADEVDHAMTIDVDVSIPDGASTSATLMIRGGTVG